MLLPWSLNRQLLSNLLPLLCCYCSLERRGWKRGLCFWDSTLIYITLTWLPFYVLHLIRSMLVVMHHCSPPQLAGDYSLSLFCSSGIIETNMVATPLPYGPSGVCTRVASVCFDPSVYAWFCDCSYSGLCAHCSFCCLILSPPLGEICSPTYCVSRY